MRYEIRKIETGKFGELYGSTDDASEAKRIAEAHAYESYYGTAIIDIEAQTVDCGDRVISLDEAFA